MAKDLNGISYSVNSIHQLSEKDATTEHKYIPYIAKASFAIYLFFVFFGTRIPFAGKAENVEDL
ncbi:MAG: hypothetical protein ACW99A_15055, partial [Candidatus Kariarchaeaceae archaeon]